MSPLLEKSGSELVWEPGFKLGWSVAMVMRETVSYPLGGSIKMAQVAPVGYPLGGSIGMYLDLYLVKFLCHR